MSVLVFEAVSRGSRLPVVLVRLDVGSLIFEKELLEDAVVIRNRSN